MCGFYELYIRRFNLLRVLCWCASFSEHYVAFLLPVFYIFTFLSHKFVVPIVYKNIVNAECHINTITEHTGFMSLFQYIRNMRYRCNAWALHHLKLYLHASADSKLSLREHNTKWLYFIMSVLCAQHIWTYCTKTLWHLWEIWVLCEVTAVHAFTEFPYVFREDKRQ